MCIHKKNPKNQRTLLEYVLQLTELEDLVRSFRDIYSYIDCIGGRYSIRDACIAHVIYTLDQLLQVNNI